MTFCFGWYGIVVFRNKGVRITYGFEENIESGFVLDLPEHCAVTKPGVREDAIDATHDVSDCLDLRIACRWIVRVE